MLIKLIWRIWLTICLVVCGQMLSDGQEELSHSLSVTDNIQTKNALTSLATNPRPDRLSLAQATEILVANNLSVLAARYNVDILRAQRIAAQLRPSATITFSANQIAVPKIFHHPSYLYRTDINSAANSTYTVEVDQLIERGGKLKLRTSQAELNAEAAEAQLRDAIRQQTAQLQQVYFTALLARENYRVAADNLQSFTHTEKLLQAQVREGYAAGVDVLRLNLQQLQYERDVETAKLSYRQSIRDVFNLIGAGDAPSLNRGSYLVNASVVNSPEPPDGAGELIQGELEVEPILLSVEELRKLALDNRPDVKAASLFVEAAARGLDLAAAQKTRDVTVGVQYARTGMDHTAGLVLSLPLATGRRAEAAIAQATSTRLQAQALYRQATAQALTDVEKAYSAYQTACNRLRLFNGAALRTAADVKRIEEISYREGAKGLLDFIDAQRTYNQTLVDYNQARFDYVSSVYQLESATATKLVK